MVAKSPAHQGEHEGNRNTIAQETPDRSAEPVVTMLVCFLILHMRLRVWPHARRFLRPLYFEGLRSKHNSDVKRREKALLYLRRSPDAAQRETVP